jgi:hypothetical protein
LRNAAARQGATGVARRIAARFAKRSDEHDPRHKHVDSKTFR